MSKWTKEEIDLLLIYGDKEVSVQTGRTEPAIRGKRQRLTAAAAKTCVPTQTYPYVFAKYHGDVSSFPLGPGGQLSAAALASDPTPNINAGCVLPKTFEQDRTRHDNQYWQGQYKLLSTKYERALKEQSVIEQLVAAIKDIAPISYCPQPAVAPGRKKDSSAQSAVLLLSDTHVGQVITPDQTLGFGGYDFPTFLARLKFLETGVASIIQDHTTTSVDELVICLGGDMMNGALNHGAEAGQHNTLFQQFYGAGHALAQFIRNLAPFVPAIRIFCTVGNHPRWQNQHRMPTTNRYSNLDHFLSAYVEALTRDLPNVKWTVDKQPMALFDVQGFRFQLLHGDTLRGGDRALGIPNHAVGRHVSSTTQLFHKHGQRSPDFYLCGHLHRGIVLPHAKGAFIVNGGFPGMDGYGLANGFSPVDPSQVFFFVHPKFGKTATYELQLKFAEVTSEPPYTLPDGLECA